MTKVKMRKMSIKQTNGEGMHDLIKTNKCNFSLDACDFSFFSLFDLWVEVVVANAADG